MEQIFKIALSIIFGMAAFAKFSGKTKDTFQKSGFGLPFMYAVAFAEVILSVGLFTMYDLWAVIGLLAISIGAFVTLIKQRVTPAKYGLAFLSLILLLVLLIVRLNMIGGSPYQG